MIRDAIRALTEGHSLPRETARAVMEELMTGQATPAQVGAFLTALRMKGETPDELAEMARVMREKAVPVEVPFPVVDTCGTGGDGQETFNISTVAALVAAGAGLRVAKHGNRGMSSACGSADLLAALGVAIELGPEGARRCLEEVGIAFLFAPVYHPAMRFVAGPRREIGIRTAFNLLGPLTNPANPRRQVVGVARADLAEKVAQTLARLGAEHALVLHGEDGLDEATLAGPTRVWEVRDRAVSAWTLTPEDLGLPRAPTAALRGGTVERNREMALGVLEGRPGPARDVVLLNAALALWVGGAVETPQEGVQAAREALDSGRALAKLQALADLSQRLQGEAHG